VSRGEIHFPECPALTVSPARGMAGNRPPVGEIRKALNMKVQGLAPPPGNGQRGWLGPMLLTGPGRPERAWAGWGSTPVFP
jgi:hypothetical protein